MWFLCHLSGKYLRKLKLRFEGNAGCGMALDWRKSKMAALKIQFFANNSKT